MAMIETDLMQTTDAAWSALLDEGTLHFTCCRYNSAIVLPLQGNF